MKKNRLKSFRNIEYYEVFNRFDAYLIRNQPIVWILKAHYVVLYGSILLFFVWFPAIQLCPPITITPFTSVGTMMTVAMVVFIGYFFAYDWYLRVNIYNENEIFPILNMFEEYKKFFLILVVVFTLFGITVIPLNMLVDKKMSKNAITVYQNDIALLKHCHIVESNGNRSSIIERFSKTNVDSQRQIISVVKKYSLRVADSILVWSQFSPEAISSFDSTLVQQDSIMIEDEIMSDIREVRTYLSVVVDPESRSKILLIIFVHLMYFPVITYLSRDWTYIFRRISKPLYVLLGLRLIIIFAQFVEVNNGSSLEVSGFKIYLFPTLKISYIVLLTTSLLWALRNFASIKVNSLFTVDQIDYIVKFAVLTLLAGDLVATIIYGDVLITHLNIWIGTAMFLMVLPSVRRKSELLRSAPFIEYQ